MQKWNAQLAANYCGARFMNISDPQLTLIVFLDLQENEKQGRLLTNEQ